VASFCTKCGAAVSPDVQFCTTCGASTATAPTGYAAPAPVQYSQPYVPPTAVSPNSGGSALKIILIIVAVFVGLGIIGAGIVAFTAWRVAHAIHLDANGENMTLHTPGGTISTNQSKTYSASDLGTDIYPGAQSGHGSMKMDLPTGSMVTGVFVTSDSKDQVLDFYKSRFGSGASVIDTGETAILTLKKGEQESVMVTISARNSGTDGKTRISIMHTKATKGS
jgi:zinc-ribbon domain